MMAEGKAENGVNTAIDRVVSDIEGQLLGAGVERSTAKTQAQLMRGVAVLAHMADLTPREPCLERYADSEYGQKNDAPHLRCRLRFGQGKQHAGKCKRFASRGCDVGLMVAAWRSLMK